MFNGGSCSCYTIYPIDTKIGMWKNLQDLKIIKISQRRSYKLIDHTSFREEIPVPTYFLGPIPARS